MAGLRASRDAVDGCLDGVRPQAYVRLVQVMPSGDWADNLLHHKPLDHGSIVVDKKQQLLGRDCGDLAALGV